MSETPATDVEFRVRYAETDQMGRAYYGAYFAWFEVGRAEVMRKLDLAYRELEAQGYLLAVAEARAKYLAPAGYDEMVVVRTRLARAGKSRVEFLSEVISRESGRKLAEGSVTLACVGPDGMPRRLPAELRERIGKAASEAASSRNREAGDRPKEDK
jgi:acyl-CoA thioester hydrolase